MPRQFPDVLLDAMVLMPNYLHGIVITGAEPAAGVSHLSEVIGWFKSHTARDYGIGVRMQGWPRFNGRLWQIGYYDHVVRNDADLRRVREYIAGNPGRWQTDEHYSD